MVCSRSVDWQVELLNEERGRWVEKLQKHQNEYPPQFWRIDDMTDCRVEIMRIDKEIKEWLELLPN